MMQVTDKATGARLRQGGHLEARTRATAPTRRWQGLSALKPVFADGQRVKAGTFITAGNASQLSDGASAVRR